MSWFGLYDLVVAVALVAKDREGAVVAGFLWGPDVVLDWTDNMLTFPSLYVRIIKFVFLTRITGSLAGKWLCGRNLKRLF